MDTHFVYYKKKQFNSVCPGWAAVPFRTRCVFINRLRMMVLF